MPPITEITDEVLVKLLEETIAPGKPFEVINQLIDGVEYKVFKSGPKNLAELYATGMERDSLYAEAFRVLRPGGRFVVYDVLQGEGGDVRYPVPWANDSSTSFLATPEEMRALLNAALNAARENGVKNPKAVAAGYCFGGAAVLEMARSGADLLGFVSFHGGLSTPAGQDYSKTRGQVLILHGTADESVSMNDFALLAQQLEKAHVPHEMISYGGAPHAFTVFGSDSYRADADRKSWQRFSEFLAATLK